MHMHMLINPVALQADIFPLKFRIISADTVKINEMPYSDFVVTVIVDVELA